MAGLSPQLSRQLLQTLSRCGPFDSEQALRARFVDERLNQWRDGLPETNSRAERIRATVDYLYRRKRSTGENGLVVLLQVLRDDMATGDLCHEKLAVLAERVRQATQETPTPPGAELPATLTGPLKRIQRLLTRRQLLLFIGNDLPAEITGTPSQDELAAALAADFDLADFGAFASGAELVPDRWSLVLWLQEQLGSMPALPGGGDYAAGIAALVDRYDVDLVVTTAVDGRLAQILEQSGLAVNAIGTDSQLQLARPDRPDLIQLFGDIRDPDSLVLTAQDHRALQRGALKPLLMQRLRAELNQRGILAFGQRLSDPTFLALLDTIAGERFQAPSFAVWHRASPGQKDAMLRLRGLNVIEAQPAPVLWSLSRLSDSLPAE